MEEKRSMQKDRREFEEREVGYMYIGANHLR